MGEVTTLIWWQNLIISVSFQPRRQNLLIIQRENELICHFCFDMNSMTLIFTFNILDSWLLRIFCCPVPWVECILILPTENMALSNNDSVAGWFLLRIKNSIGSVQKSWHSMNNKTCFQAKKEVPTLLSMNLISDKVKNICRAY